jgi:hypothetical protein
LLGGGSPQGWRTIIDAISRGQGLAPGGTSPTPDLRQRSPMMGG